MREGSIIIDYTLSAQQQLLDMATTKTEQSVGQSLILRVGGSWDSWKLDSFIQVVETTTPAPVTSAPTPVPVVLTPILPDSLDEEQTVEQEESAGGLTTPILLVVLIGGCLLCVVIAVLVNHACRKSNDGEYHHKYASGMLSDFEGLLL